MEQPEDTVLSPVAPICYQMSDSEDTPIATHYVPINFSEFTDSNTENLMVDIFASDHDFLRSHESSSVVQNSESDQSTEYDDDYHGVYLENGVWKYPKYGEPGFYESGAAYFHENWPKRVKEKPKFSIRSHLDEIGWVSSSQSSSGVEKSESGPSIKCDDDRHGVYLENGKLKYKYWPRTKPKPKFSIRSHLDEIGWVPPSSKPKPTED